MNLHPLTVNDLLVRMNCKSKIKEEHTFVCVSFTKCHLFTGMRYFEQFHEVYKVLA